MKESSLSKWGIWKRQQRDKPANGKVCSKCKKRPAEVKHHVDGSTPRPTGHTTSWCRQCHAAHHNALRKRAK